MDHDAQVRAAVEWMQAGGRITKRGFLQQAREAAWLGTDEDLLQVFADARKTIRDVAVGIDRMEQKGLLFLRYEMLFKQQYDRFCFDDARKTLGDMAKLFELPRKFTVRDLALLLEIEGKYCLDDVTSEIPAELREKVDTLKEKVKNDPGGALLELAAARKKRG